MAKKTTAIKKELPLLPPLPPTQPSATSEIHPNFLSNRYILGRAGFNTIKVYDENKQLKFVCKKKFSFKGLGLFAEEYGVYPDERCSEEILTLRREIAVPTYHLIDPRNNTEIGQVKQKLFKVFQIEWHLFSGAREIGKVIQSSETATLGLVIGEKLTAQKYLILAPNGAQVAEIKEIQGFFSTKGYELTVFSQNIDPRFLVASAILMFYYGAR